MSVTKFYSIVVNGVETNQRKRFRDATYTAYKLRQKHGEYAVWIRPHFSLAV